MEENSFFYSHYSIKLFISFDCFSINFPLSGYVLEVLFYLSASSGGKSKGRDGDGPHHYG